MYTYPVPRRLASKEQVTKCHPTHSFLTSPRRRFHYFPATLCTCVFSIHSSSLDPATLLLFINKSNKSLGASSSSRSSLRYQFALACSESLCNVVNRLRCTDTCNDNSATDYGSQGPVSSSVTINHGPMGEREHANDEWCALRRDPMAAGPSTPSIRAWEKLENWKIDILQRGRSGLS